MSEFFLKLLSYPPIGRFALNMMKKNVLKTFQIPLDEMTEKQEKMLKKKFKKMEGTEIGRKLGVKGRTNLQELPLTDYAFYEAFFNNPSPNAFMYPLETYERIKTSATAGKEKWFMIPRNYIRKTIIETTFPIVLLSTYDGKKITIEYGDNIYLNTAPRPFLGGVMSSVGSGKSGKTPIFNISPNYNIPFKDKIKYFINNCEKIDMAVIQASILVSRIMPEVKKTIKLKGLFCPDTTIAEIYFDEISKFAGVPPKTLYNSTETLSCSIPSAQHKLSFFLDWRRGLFEFIPLNGGIADKDKVVGIDRVEVGEVYQIIYTSLETELTRYNTFNAFRCVAKRDDLLGIDHPIFKFHMRLEKAISLHNFTRISEDELITAFRESRIPFVEFTTREEIENGLEYLIMYVETTEDRRAEEIQELIHKRLYDTNGDYRDLVDFYGYVPVRVHLVPRGTFAEYLTKKVAGLSKVDRINMRDEDFKRLTQFMRKRR